MSCHGKFCPQVQVPLPGQGRGRGVQGAHLFCKPSFSMCDCRPLPLMVTGSKLAADYMKARAFQGKYEKAAESVGG